MNPGIIGLAGSKGVGKDTAYGFIQELLPDKKINRDAFADRLKIVAARAIGVKGDAAECIRDMNWLKQSGYVAIGSDDGKIKGGITGREYLELFGSAHREVFGRDVWLDLVMDARLKCDLLVLTDVRFENEAQRIRDYCGEVWRIERPDHDSEHRLPDELVDRTINNDGTLDDLRSILETMLPTFDEFGNQIRYASLDETSR